MLSWADRHDRREAQRAEARRRIALAHQEFRRCFAEGKLHSIDDFKAFYRPVTGRWTFGGRLITRYLRQVSRRGMPADDSFYVTLDWLCDHKD